MFTYAGFGGSVTGFLVKRCCGFSGSLLHQLRGGAGGGGVSEFGV